MAYEQETYCGAVKTATCGSCIVRLLREDTLAAVAGTESPYYVGEGLKGFMAELPGLIAQYQAEMGALLEMPPHELGLTDAEVEDRLHDPVKYLSSRAAGDALYRLGLDLHPGDVEVDPEQRTPMTGLIRALGGCVRQHYSGECEISPVASAETGRLPISLGPGDGIAVIQTTLEAGNEPAIRALTGRLLEEMREVVGRHGGEELPVSLNLNPDTASVESCRQALACVIDYLESCKV